MAELQRPVVSIIVERTGCAGSEVLLQRRTKLGDPFDGTLEFPQGKVERHESIFEAAQRELKEESGLRLTSLRDAAGKELRDLHGLHAFVPLACVVDTLHNYFAVAVVGTAEGATTDTAEAAAHSWTSLEDLRHILRSERLFPLNVPMLEAYIRSAGESHRG